MEFPGALSWRRWRRRVLGVCLGAALLAGSVVRANENTIEFDPSLAGQLVPTNETGVEVKNEYLDIVFDECLQQREFIAMIVGMGGGAVRVEVTARYTLHNTSWKPCELNLAFPIVRTGPEDKVNWVRTSIATFINKEIPKDLRHGVRSSVTVDGKPIAYEYISFESLFEKERAKWAAGVRTWLKQYPEILAGLEGPLTTSTQNQDPRTKAQRSGGRYFFNWDRLDGKIDAAFRSNKDRINYNLVRAMRATQMPFYPTIEDWDLDFLSYAYAYLHPKEEDSVAKFLKTWGVEDQFLNSLTKKLQPNDFLSHMTSHSDLAVTNHRIDFLNYRVKFWPRESRVVEVHYSHLMNAAIYPNWELQNSRGIGPTNLQNFQYILRTSPKWKAFGPIYLTLDAERNPKYHNPASELHTLVIPKGSEVRENLHVTASGYDHLTGNLIWTGPPSMMEGTFARDNGFQYIRYIMTPLLALSLAGFWIRSRSRRRKPGAAAIS